MTRVIWLASYPKSGNTWFRLLAANLAAPDGKPVDINAMADWVGIASARELFDRVLLIDSGLLSHDEADNLRPRVYEAIKQGENPDEDAPAQPVRLVKVHDAYTFNASGEALLAGSRGADGAIVIVRDPRDIAPSLANHLDSDLDEAIAFMNDAGADFGAKPGRLNRQLRQKLPGWSGHVASWLDQRDIPVCLLRYEDLKADTVGALRHALQFAGIAAADDDIRRAVAAADFSRLQAHEKEKGFREAPQGGAFFRRGEVGSWREELTAEQVRRIENGHSAMMLRLGYAPTYGS